jgi:hypothetical protein
MADIAQAPKPLNVGYYESYFSEVAAISNEMGLSYMTLSPDNQDTLKHLLHDYKILQQKRVSDKQKIVPIKLIFDKV